MDEEQLEWLHAERRMRAELRRQARNPPRERVVPQSWFGQVVFALEQFVIGIVASLLPSWRPAPIRQA